MELREKLIALLKEDERGDKNYTLGMLADAILALPDIKEALAMCRRT